VPVRPVAAGREARLDALSPPVSVPSRIHGRRPRRARTVNVALALALVAATAAALAG
jgi:hypothetical protein